MNILQKHFKRLMGFSIVGALSTVTSLLLVFIGNEILHFNQYLVYALSYVLTILLSYYLNSRYVWRAKGTFLKLLKFFAVYLSSMILGLVILRFFNYLFEDANHTLLGYFTIPFTMLWNYLFANRILTK